MDLHIHLTLGGVLIFLGIIAIPILCKIFGDCEDSGGWFPPMPFATMFFTMVVWVMLIIIYVIFH